MQLICTSTKQSVLNHDLCTITNIKRSETIKYPSQEARNALHDSIMDPAMPDFAPVIVLANKQDMGEAYSPEQLANHLDIHQLG